MGDGTHRRRRALWRAVSIAAFVGLAAGTTGGVPSILERWQGDRVYGQGTAAAAPAPPPAPSTAPPDTAPPSTTPPPPAAWVLMAGGDVLMDRSEPLGLDPFAGLVPPLRDADVAVVNVEMAITEGGTAQVGKEFTFRAPPSAATTLAAAGIDVGALGNNHAADFGIDALVETVRHLRGAGVRPVGAGRNADEAFAPAVVEVARPGSAPVSVAFVSASGVVPAGFAAADSTPGIASAYEQQRLLDAVTAAAEAHDVVVALLHWGVERAPCPTVSQVALGDALVGAGAHVVVGSHPHVLQPVVERGGGVIAYSLGNFAWHSRSGPQGETGVLEVRFVGDRVDGFSFHPHMLDASGAPVPANAAAAARIESAVERACPVVV